MEEAKNQHSGWKKEEKCLKLQKKFGGYDHFETNPNNNKIIANKQSVYFCVKDILKGNNYSLLEVGSGPGHFLWSLKDFAGELDGLEYSEHMMELCEEQFKKTDKKVRLIQGSCWKLPYEDNEFDVSLQCDVCRHIGGCWTSLAEQIRVTRKYVVFSGPSFEKWGSSQPLEKELSKLLFGINLDLFEEKLNNMKKGGVISNYYYKDRPNKEDRLNRKILVVECS